MSTHLIHATTGETIQAGDVLHPVKSDIAGRWHFEGIVKTPDPLEGHPGTILARTSKRTAVGRVHTHCEFEPHVFGCKIEVDIHVYFNHARLMRTVRRFAASVGGLTVGGVSAWWIAEFLTHHFGG